jgi:3'-phosphoadenosine 5'-phosphosulfate sulfotransferase (PAPS reductase)/FAD synthetase
MPNLPTIEKLVADGALFVSNHSGGKDSQATLIELLKYVPASQIIVVHASLGEAEWPLALEKAQEHAAKHNLPFLVAKANKTFFQMVERRFETRPDAPSFPDSANRQCTSDLKRDPIAKAVRHYADAHGFKLIVNCLGIRSAESTSRAKKNPFQINNRETNSKRTWIEWFPIFKLTTAQVFKAIADAGEELHYAYKLGNERLSCVFCIMGSRGDCQNGAKHNPELFQKYVQLEAKVGYTMQKKSLLELVLGQPVMEGALAA